MNKAWAIFARGGCSLLIAHRSRQCFFIQQSKINIQQFLSAYNRFAMVAKELLDLLVCPACKHTLEYRQNPETLKCTACHRVYPVRDDIPIMLVDEATLEP
jgi:uncharacterized protein